MNDNYFFFFQKMKRRELMEEWIHICVQSSYIKILSTHGHTLRLKSALMMQRQSTMSRTFFPLCIKNRNCRTFQLDLVLLSCLYNFNCPADQKILQADGAARMFYVPDTKWLIVLPINYILGRMRLILLAQAHLRFRVNFLALSNSTSSTGMQIEAEFRAEGACCSC